MCFGEKFIIFVAKIATFICGKSKFEKLADDLKTYNEQLMAENRILSEELSKLTSINNDLQTSNSIMEKNIEELKSENDKLETHISKLKIIQDNANNLIKSLMTAGDNFNEFSKSLNEHIDHLDDTAHMLDTLLIKLKESKFKEIDKNANGVITADEFDEWMDE